MRFQTLESCDVELLQEVFQKSFADYLVPIKISVPQLRTKLKRDAVVLSLSPGVSPAEKLAGFILNGIDSRDGKQTAYNAGTGVIPYARGQHATRKMYDYILPALKTAQVERCLLEVIVGNDRAIHTYRAIGFEIIRELICYKGEAPLPPILPASIQLQESQQVDWGVWKSFGDWRPSWQNDDPAIKRIQADHRFIQIYEGNQLRGYAAYLPDSGYVSQFAVHPKHRGRKFGTALLAHIGTACHQTLRFINIDASAQSTLPFLRSLDIQETVRQYEMAMNI